MRKLAVTVLLAVATGPCVAQQPLSAADKAKFFETKVAPILQANCLACHGGEKKIKGSFNLTTRAGIVEGGNTGPGFNEKKPAESLLLEAVNHAASIRMPPKGKLAKAQIDILTEWVEMGLPWSAKNPFTSKKHGSPQVDDDARNWWAYKPVTRPKVPREQLRAWVRNPIDYFVLAKLEANGLEPNPPASNTALLRRVYYDLIGLPPTPEQVAAFLKDGSPAAYEKVVDSLLASPQHGERWARHWLDLVRYAETNSFERDGPKPHIWRYRDYVIKSFNQDKPYDQFIREQLAGDEIEPRTPEGLIATGFYRLGLWDDEPADPLLALYDELDDIASTTGQVFLGMTVGCARCHDHKIDPFPQKDYYRLVSFFSGIDRYGVRSNESVAKASLRPLPLTEVDKQHQGSVEQYKARLKEVLAELQKIEDEVRPQLQGGEKDDFKFEATRTQIVRKYAKDDAAARYTLLRKEKSKLEKAPPAPLAMAMCVTEIGAKPREITVLPRGNPHNKGDKVEPGFPSVLTTQVPKLPVPEKDAKTSGRRTVLADWIASPSNPLTPRVMANRLWQFHFGRGIVRTTSDFGYQGLPPTHPELLDWLASEFVASGWKMKHMHRLIVLSNAYRMSSQPRPATLAKDPENDLLWRFDLRRLSAEEVRDSILAVSGNLNPKMGGPSIYPEIPKEVLAGQSIPGNGWPKSSPEEAARRSVYVHIKRSLALPLLSAFDAADPDSTCAVRFTTTQPAQALALINSDFSHQQAKVFAEDVRKQAGPQVGDQVRLALRRVLQREPEQKQLDRGLGFLELMQQRHGQTAEQAMQSFCLLALNLNEFLYLE